MKLPNTRVSNGSIQFRKTYQGQQVVRSWPEREIVQATKDIYDLLAQMAKGEKLVLEIEHRMTVDEACATFEELHAPSLKTRPDCAPSEQPAYNLKCRLNVIKAAWPGRFFDSITPLEVRDFLNRFDTVGTRMKYLGTLTKMFNSFVEWNEDGELKVPVKLPKHNPAKRWRGKMETKDKTELPRNRVLTEQEWNALKQHMTDRCRQVCEVWLFQFLNMADIKQIHRMTVKGQLIEGVREKSGMRYQVPMLDGRPEKYDTTNFEREFHAALVAAKMDYPKDHAMHLTPRDLRRTGATWYYRKAKDNGALEKLRRMLGHSKISTTIRYLGLDDSDMAEAAQVMQDIRKNLAKDLANFPKSDEDLNQIRVVK
jgi:integrase